VLNPELLRRDADRTRAVLARRDDDAVKAFDAAIVADEEWRRLTAEVEGLRAERRQRASARRGRPSEEEVAEERRLGDRLGALEAELKAKEDERQAALAWVPNLPDPSVPAGKDDSENEILQRPSTSRRCRMMNWRSASESWTWKLAPSWLGRAFSCSKARAPCCSARC
jgi:seryl-tRNA synthetase